MKKIILMLGVTFILGMIGCGNEMESIFSDEIKIAQECDSYNINRDETIIDGKEYTRILEIEGMDTIWTYDAKEDMELDLEYFFRVDSGNAKLVFIDALGNIRLIAHSDISDTILAKQTKKLFLKKGRNRIKIVGKKKANLELEASIEEGDWSEGTMEQR
ncbi:MAG: hypothetical protein ACRC6T_00305 [Sarcina sp.]